MSNVDRCTQDHLVLPPNSEIMWVRAGDYAIVRCGEGYVMTSGGDGIVYCNDASGTWQHNGLLFCSAVPTTMEMPDKVQQGMSLPVWGVVVLALSIGIATALAMVFVVVYYKKGCGAIGCKNDISVNVTTWSNQDDGASSLGYVSSVSAFTGAKGTDDVQQARYTGRSELDRSSGRRYPDAQNPPWKTDPSSPNDYIQVTLPDRSMRTAHPGTTRGQGAAPTAVATLWGLGTVSGPELLHGNPPAATTAVVRDSSSKGGVSASVESLDKNILNANTASYQQLNAIPEALEYIYSPSSSSRPRP